MIGIYKIENLLNHKIYVGQSVHIERRWSEHCNKNKSSLISKAIQKYGKENFSFQVICECSIEELNNLEEKYIHYYDSIVPKGYNVVDVCDGKATQYCYYSEEVLRQIIADIKNGTSFQVIGEKYDLSTRNIYYINRGEIHSLPDVEYPIRNFPKTEKCYCVDCGIEITRGAIRCQKCDHKRQERVRHPDRQTLKDLIRTKSFCEIGRQYGVSDNSIRKWCKSYNLPTKRADIKCMTDEQWQSV